MTDIVLYAADDVSRTVAIYEGLSISDDIINLNVVSH
jgi:hypothetical protein